MTQVSCDMLYPPFSHKCPAICLIPHSAQSALFCPVTCFTLLLPQVPVTCFTPLLPKLPCDMYAA